MTDASTGAQPVKINPNGELFDKDGNLVKFKPTKAVIGGVLSLATSITVPLTAIYTESVPLVIANIVIGAVATTLGIFLPTNTVARHRA